jgi:hypothetical protein
MKRGTAQIRPSVVFKNKTMAAIKAAEACLLLVKRQCDAGNHQVIKNKIINLKSIGFRIKSVEWREKLVV